MSGEGVTVKEADCLLLLKECLVSGAAIHHDASSKLITLGDQSFDSSTPTRFICHGTTDCYPLEAIWYASLNLGSSWGVYMQQAKKWKFGLISILDWKPLVQFLKNQLSMEELIEKNKVKIVTEPQKKRIKKSTADDDNDESTTRPTTDDPRLSSLVNYGDAVSTSQVVIVGFPADEGVRRNGGRVGAARGPERFRYWMGKLGCLDNREENVDISSLRVSDCGGVIPDASLETMHDNLKTQVKIIVESGGIPFVVGGGNDQSYPNACGLMEALSQTNSSNSSSHDGDNEAPRSIACVNIDAHFDVRPRKLGQVHSGSPFRLLCEDPRFDPKLFTEFGCQGNQCSAEHVKYLEECGSTIVWLKQVQREGAAASFSRVLESFGDSPIFVSFDVDSIAGADCPGVSCVASRGLSAQDAYDICRIAGANPRVRLFDMSEYNPQIEDYRTGRLLATMFYYFLIGYAQRKTNP